jgi:hypothetical protein
MPRNKGSVHHKEVDVYWFLYHMSFPDIPTVKADSDGWWPTDTTPTQYAAQEKRRQELLDWLWERMDHRRVLQFAPLAMNDAVTRAAVSEWGHRSRNDPPHGERPRTPYGSSYYLIFSFRKYCLSMSPKKARARLRKEPKNEQESPGQGVGAR